MAELARVQQWMQQRIFAGGAASEFAEAIVAGDARLAPADRIGIYAGGYRGRLVDCLRGEYPSLRRFAGDTVFDLFAQSYIAAHPPTARSLYGFGAGFALYLEATRPRPGGDPLAALPAQVARLERARGEVQRAEGVERRAGRPPSAGAAMLPGLRLKLPDSVRLLRLDFDLLPLIEACDRDEKAAVPERRETLIAVARSHYRVRLHALEPWRHAWLTALGFEGEEVHIAAAAAARASGREGGALLADLVLWIPTASAAGLVIAA